MKYAQLLIGLLAGTALGSSVVASTGKSGSMDTESVKKIVREVIMEEPKLILESVQKMQTDEQKKQMESASEALKDPALVKEIFENANAGSIGPKDSKRVVAEFFDYNCPACKMMFKSLDAVLKKDPAVRVVFHEYPIFGPQSDTNAKIAIAVNRLSTDKYFEFHARMIAHEGKIDEKVALSIVKELGMDPKEVKAESEKKEVAEVLDANRKLGEKLHIQGTPTLVIGDEIVPHGMSPEELESKLSGTSGAAKTEDAAPPAKP